MKKRALLIAINAYPDSPLSGCLNDVILLYKILKDVYGFSEFKILDDKKATRKNIMRGLQWLVNNLQDNDKAFWGYSGHGTQVNCTTETATWETDRMDECICPIDMDWDLPLRDDDINKVIMCANPNAHLLCHIDACFSGTILKNSPTVKNGHFVKSRYMPPPLHVLLESGDMELDENLKPMTSRLRQDRLRSQSFLHNVTTQGNAVLISGSSDAQTSADAFIDGHYNGAMTYYLAQTLKEANWNISYCDLVAKINEKLEKNGFNQTPQLESKDELMDQLFLGGTH